MVKRPMFAAVCLLAALLPGLGVAQEATVLSGQVTTKDDGLPVPNATVSIDALNLSTTADAEGRYQLTIPAGASGPAELKVAAPGLAAKTVRVNLTPGSMTLNVPLGLSFHEEITVGSRAAGTEAEKAVPVDILSQRQIVATGASETNQVIQALAPSFNFPRATISDGADTIRPATLRGLAPDQVLVLINGKRRHPYAHIVTSNVIGRGTSGVDLNAIPASAIEKIEILRDGAAAQYGSDAIAGVINIVLKAGAHPLTLSGKAGMTTGSYVDLTGAERDHSDGELTEGTASYGWNVGRGSVFVTTEYRNRNGTNRATPDVRDQIRAGDAGNNPVGQPNHHWGDSEQRDLMGFLNASFPLGGSDTTSLYLFGGASKRDGSHGGFYRRALDARNWPSIYPLGFLPTIQPEVIDVSGTVGVRGARDKWFWDLSAQYGHNSFDFNIVNTLNVSLGPAVPPNKTEFYSGSQIANELVANLDLARETEIGLAGPLNVAFGLEYRRDNYQQIAGEPDSWRDAGSLNQFGGRADVGAQVFPGFRPSNAADASRNSVAAYVDLEGDVHQKIRLGLAGRFEHFSDFGATGDGKLTARLAPHPRFVLRGALSTGFRAPSLSQANFSSVSTNFITVGGVVTPVEVGNFAVNSPIARALGAQDLRPEESVHYSGGVVWNPVDPLEITADVYRIDIDDRVVFSGNFTGPRIEALVRPFGANGGRFFTNAIDTKTQGADLRASYRADLDTAGTLLLMAAYNRTDTDIVGTVATPSQLVGLENVLFDREQTERVTCGQPKDNVRLSADWQRRRLGSVVRASRYGEFCFPTNVPANDQTFAPKWLVDLDLSFGTNRYSIGVGAQNLFDTFPDLLIPANSSFVVQTFPGANPFGFNGRFLYARMTYRF